MVKAIARLQRQIDDIDRALALLEDSSEEPNVPMTQELWEHCLTVCIINPILFPVREVCRFETRLMNPTWNFNAYNGGIYPCRADAVAVCQNLIRTENGYERCLKARVKGLEICFQRFGWSYSTDVVWGFPGIVTWDNDLHSLNLFVSQQQYGFNELAQATADVADIGRIDLAVMVADILGEG